METRNVTITLEKAIELFHCKDESLREIALQAFDKDELTYNFKSITTFKMACEALGLNYDAISSIAENIATVSKASAAMFKLNIIRKALHLHNNLCLTYEKWDDGRYCSPHNPFVATPSCYETEIKKGRIEVLGQFKYRKRVYHVLNCNPHFDVDIDNRINLGAYHYCSAEGKAPAHLAFLGCHNKGIAQHFGKHFGMLITEAKYGDLVDFKIIKDKYNNCQD